MLILWCFKLLQKQSVLNRGQVTLLQWCYYKGFKEIEADFRLYQQEMILRLYEVNKTRTEPWCRFPSVVKIYVHVIMDIDTCMFRRPTNICCGGLCGAKHRSRFWEHSNEEDPGRAQPSGRVQARRWSLAGWPCLRLEES